MVSEITRFYCKPDMTSSWFLRQGALHAIFHDAFWKSDHDFLIALYSNFLVAMHVFRNNEVLLLPDMTSSWFLRLGVLQAIFHDGFWKSEHDFLLVGNGNFCPNSNGLAVIRHFVCAWEWWDFRTGSEILEVLGKNDPQKVKISKNTCLKGTSLSQSACFKLLYVKIGSQV